MVGLKKEASINLLGIINVLNYWEIKAMHLLLEILFVYNSQS
jgi:hypothetical protein